ncbi:MAG: hypothetical protein ABIP63_03510 [Thermoanaerobaculia bacterium]
MARQQGPEIIASDRRDDELVALCRDALSSTAGMLARAVTLARIVCRVTREGATVAIETTLVLTCRTLSVVTTPKHWEEDERLLQGLAKFEPFAQAPHNQPLLWCHGSAAVLLHEAAGHAAEHQALPAAWPSWLRVEDRSGCGSADLLAGQIPCAWRRESFTDIPLARMTSVLVQHSGAPFVLPAERLEILLVAGGAYDPLTDEVSIQVAAARSVSARGTTPVKPFALRAPRSLVAAALSGASGLPEHYPGVICSREGQELYVSSAAPRILTDSLPMV